MAPEVDEGIAAVRRIREEISREAGNDPQRLIQHYLDLQETFEGALIRGPEAINQRV